MGQKISATALRLGITTDWKSLWYAEKEEYVKNLHQDIKIREFINKELKPAGLDNVEISRSLNKTNVDVHVARPGIAIGRGGEGIEKLKNELQRRFGKDIDIKIKEVKKPELSAKVIAYNIATGMEKRQSPKRLMITEREKAMQAGALGIKIWISGDFGVPKQSRTIKMEFGTTPLQRLRADIDFAEEAAAVRNAGKHGVKVWVYKGDIKKNSNEKESEK
ncbi:30S ribosomal protein S3 [Candidatus Dojkabacteria bacterium]|nr:30S ribosomal protein S3 [Candidatus Dojkabacteria bacterium]